MCSDIFLCDICWQARDMDHFGWCTAIAIVLGSIVVETVQRQGGKICCVWRWVDLCMLGEVTVHLFPRQGYTLAFNGQQ